MVLVQQNLAFWYTQRTFKDTLTHYEANLEGAYSLVRSGKHIKAIEDHHGKIAGSLFSHVLLSGYASVSELEQTLKRKIAETGGNNGHQVGVANGVSSRSESPEEGNDATPTRKSIFSTVHELLQRHHLSKIHLSYFHSEADNRKDAESVVRGRPKFKGEMKGKQKNEFENEVVQLLHDWKMRKTSTSNRTGEKKAPAPAKGKKRQLEDNINSEARNKKQRLENDVAELNGTGSHISPADKFLDAGEPSLARRTSPNENQENAVVHVNKDKLAVVFRNEKLTQLANEHIGKSTAAVYSALLEALGKTARCCATNKPYEEMNDDDEDIFEQRVVTIDIVANMQILDVLENSIGQVDAQDVNDNLYIHPKNRKRKPEDMQQDEDEGEADDNDDYWGADEVQANGKLRSRAFKDIVSDSSDDGDPSVSSSQLELARTHLLLLAEHPFGFVQHHKSSQSSPESWSVPYKALTAQIRRNHLEDAVRSRYGATAFRIIRILQEKGKLGEKEIANFGLINPKTLRSELATIHGGGHLELQELPRDNHRAAARTIYLWFFDEERCRLKVLEDTYQTMARCLQRLQVERELVQGLLKKAARTDVAGREAELLLPDELTALRKWQDLEEKMLGEISRLDDLVFVLRDI